MRLLCARLNMFYLATIPFLHLFVAPAPAQTNVISTVAGSGILGFSGDGGPATSAELDWPEGVAVDSAGNIFIADTNNARIRKVTPAGVITTVAGNGTAGSSGDGGPAGSAELFAPDGVTVDGAGNLFIADSPSRVRKITPAGVISTVAGNGTPGFGGDGGPATSSEIYGPMGLAVDGAGNLFIADINNDRIRKVTAAGTISTVAGNGSVGFSGDGGPATSAELNAPFGVAVDTAGNLYIADTGNYRIRKVTPAGTISTIAGTGVPGFSGDGGRALSAKLYLVFGLAVDAAGNVLIADNGRIRKVTPAGIISTVAGNGVSGFGGDGGPATSAELYQPYDVAVDSAGNLFIADSANFRIRKVTVEPTKPSINANGVVSAASYTAAVAPGSIAASFGSFLLSSPAEAQATPLPLGISGLSMQFDGATVAPLFYVSGSQVNLQVPWELAGQSQVPITVSADGQTSAAQTANIVPFSPGIFSMSGTGSGQGAILDASYRLVDPSNPAMPGTTVLQIFCTGLGEVSNRPPSGYPAPSSPLAQTPTTPTVTVGGVPATVYFSGLAPGSVGEYQVNALVPATALAGIAVPVSISIGGVTSNTVTIAVQGATGTGTLNIQITGLPAGGAASVSVTSTNGYAATVTSSASLQVPSGTYTITPSPVVAGNASYNAAPQTVNVAPGTTVNALIAYDTVIPVTTKTLDQQGMQGLTVSADGGTLTLPGASTAAQSIHTGDVLAIGITPATPRGLLRMVTSVSQSGSQIVVLTTQATLADAFQQLDFKFNAPFSLQDPPAGQALPPGVSFRKGKRSVTHVRSGERSTAPSCTADEAAWVEALNVPVVTGDNGSLTASGELSICTSLEVDFNTTAIPPTLNSMLVAATISGDLHVGVSGEYQGSVMAQVPLMPALQSDPIEVDVFGVPVVLTANVTFFVGASGTVNGSFSAGVDQTAAVTLGLSYSGGQFSPVDTWTHNFTEDPLVYDASLTAKVDGGAKIDVTVDEVLTPSISPDAFLQLNVDPTANPWWTLAGGVELSACSVALDIFGIGGDLDCPDDLIGQLQLSFPIAQASGGFLPSDTIPAIAGVTPNSVAAGSSGITLTVTGSNFVPGATVNFSGAGLQSTFVSTSQITAILPPGDLTAGGTFPITVTNPAPNGGTSAPVNFNVQAANNPKPSIMNLAPSSASAGADPLTLTVNGSGFIASSTVSFNGVAHTPSFVNGGQLTIQLTSQDLSTAGSFAVVVSNPPPGGGMSAPAAFTVNSAGSLLSITQLSPSSATAGSGPIALTISGTGFTASSSVTFNGVQQNATFVSATQLTVGLGAAELATAGTYAVVVTNPGGASASAGFTVSSGGFSLGDQSVNISATVRIGGQALSSEIGAVAMGNNVYFVEMDDEFALPALPQFEVEFNATPAISGPVVTFNGASLASLYQPDLTTVGSISSTTLTVNFGTLAAGAPVSGTVTFSTSVGTVQGTFTGTITSVD